MYSVIESGGCWIRWAILNTGGPLEMRILGLVKTCISGKSHIENQKVVIPYVHDFSLIFEIKITFAAVCLDINY